MRGRDHAGEPVANSRTAAALVAWRLGRERGRRSGGGGADARSAGGYAADVGADASRESTRGELEPDDRDPVAGDRDGWAGADHDVSDRLAGGIARGGGSPGQRREHRMTVHA